MPRRSPAIRNELLDSIRIEYGNQIQSYINSLSNPFTVSNRQAWQDSESRIIDLMMPLRFFTNLDCDFNADVTMRINDNYDYRNLTHRFILLYAYYKGMVRLRNIEEVLNQRPLPEHCINIPRVPFITDDLSFLSIDPPDQLLDIGFNTIDFIVNGQKLKLSIKTTSNNEIRSQYIDTVYIRVTSERNTNPRSITRLERYDRNLVFKRFIFTQPIHGFKFVRRRDSDGLAVKEIE